MLAACGMIFNSSALFVFACLCVFVQGERVLGFAMLELPEDRFGPAFDEEYPKQPELIPTDGLVFVGLVSLVDPPKDSVPQAVLDCHTAGIKVIMVTGDRTIAQHAHSCAHPCTCGGAFLHCAVLPLMLGCLMFPLLGVQTR